MYSKILVPLDGSRVSEQILPYAGLFADAYGIPVELLGVMDPDARPPFWPPESSGGYLKKIAGEYFSGRVSASAETGAPVTVICRLCQKRSFLPDRNGNTRPLRSATLAPR